MYSIPTLTPSDISRFWSKVNVDSPLNCWEWQAYLNHSDYGMYQLDDRPFYAHRISYFLEHGTLPEGIFILHRCDNPKCVNPNHLFTGTLEDNARDRAQKHRSRDSRGEKSGSAKLCAMDIITIREILDNHPPKGTKTKLAAQYGITKATISKIVQRERWKHI